MHDKNGGISFRNKRSRSCGGEVSEKVFFVKHLVAILILRLPTLTVSSDFRLRTFATEVEHLVQFTA